MTEPRATEPGDDRTSSDVWDAERAATYDLEVADEFDPALLDPCIDLLEELADGRPVLEFAIGTGRIALPLAQRGLTVAGIELSEPMVARLRAKPGGDRLPVVVGDMASARVDGAFGLVVLVFNTIMNLTTQDAQLACFANAAAHLAPGGRFVVETLVPRPTGPAPGDRFVPFHLSDERIGIDEYDVVTQALRSHHVRRRPDGVTWTTGNFRYVWPSELDLMARAAGLGLDHRWGDWHRTPFAADSTSHVSVWSR